jgi:hypothetical protein
MNETPRTDAARDRCRTLDDLYGCQPLLHLCGQLEVQLAASRKQVKRMELMLKTQRQIDKLEAGNG